MTRFVNCWYIVVAVICGGILYFLSPTYPFEPQGILLPLTKALPATQPSDVMVYRAMPAGAKPLALINLEVHFTKLSMQYPLSLYKKAKQMAASVGANGLVQQVLTRTPQSLGKFAIYIFQGTAIKQGAGASQVAPPLLNPN